MPVAAATDPTVSPLHVTVTRPDGNCTPPRVIIKLLVEKPLAPTATPLGDVKPHALLELLVTIPPGNVSVIVPELAGSCVAVVKEMVIDRPLPRPPSPVRAGLDTQ